MFQFIKANKKFSAAVAGMFILSMAFAYGLAVRDIFSVALGSLVLVGAIAYSFGSIIKEAFILRNK